MSRKKKTQNNTDNYTDHSDKTETIGNNDTLISDLSDNYNLAEKTVTIEDNDIKKDADEKIIEDENTTDRLVISKAEETISEAPKTLRETIIAQLNKTLKTDGVKVESIVLKFFKNMLKGK